MKITSIEFEEGMVRVFYKIEEGDINVESINQRFRFIDFRYIDIEYCFDLDKLKEFIKDAIK